MMLKKFAVFGVAVLINVLILLVIFHDGSCSSEKQEQEPDKSVEKNDNKGSVDQISRPVSGAAKVIEKPNKSQPRDDVKKGRGELSKSAAYRTSRRVVKKAFDYSSALTGNIKELPASKYATTGLLVDLGSRKVIWAKNPRKAVPIASMTKMMTALLVFEELDKKQKLTMDTKIKVTKAAYKIGGSQVWLDPRETFTLRDLMKSIMIKSANDASYLVAEYLASGDVNAFITRMNAKAKSLRMPNTYFYNPHGLPEGPKKHENRSCPEGMAIIAERLLDYPEAIKMASTKLDYIRKTSKQPTMLSNHNKLVATCPGVNGMKTGYTDKAKFCVTATCNRNGRGMIAVVTGFPSSKSRNKFVSKLFKWAYNKK